MAASLMPRWTAYGLSSHSGIRLAATNTNASAHLATRTRTWCCSVLRWMIRELWDEFRARHANHALHLPWTRPLTLHVFPLGSQWIVELTQHIPDVPIILVGCKLDLVQGTGNNFHGTGEATLPFINSEAVCHISIASAYAYVCIHLHSFSIFLTRLRPSRGPLVLVTTWAAAVEQVRVSVRSLSTQHVRPSPTGREGGSDVRASSRRIVESLIMQGTARLNWDVSTEYAFRALCIIYVTRIALSSHPFCPSHSEHCQCYP